MYKIEQNKVDWVRRYPCMSFDPEQRYIIPINTLEQAQLVNDACESFFGESLLKPSLAVGNGVVIDKGVYVVPNPDKQGVFIDADVFIIQFHPDYKKREIVEVLGKQYFKDELEAYLQYLRPCKEKQSCY